MYPRPAGFYIAHAQSLPQDLTHGEASKVDDRGVRLKDASRANLAVNPVQGQVIGILQGAFFYQALQHTHDQHQAPSGTPTPPSQGLERTLPMCSLRCREWLASADPALCCQAPKAPTSISGGSPDATAAAIPQRLCHASSKISASSPLAGRPS